MISGSGSTINGNITGSQLEGDTRWNFFDYLRREYCYCKMCSSSNPSTSGESGNFCFVFKYAIIGLFY